MKTTVTIVKKKAQIKLSEKVFRAFVRTARRPDLLRLGSSYGGFWVPTSLIAPGSVVYSAGVGEDITFDEALVENFEAKVWAMDPTPRAQAFMSGKTSDRLHFLPVGLWSSDRTLHFHPPEDDNHVSHSAVLDSGKEGGFDASVETLSTIMGRHSHSRIDLLKLNIEGAEGEVIDWLAKRPLRPEVLVVAFEEASLRRRIARLLQTVSLGYQAVACQGHSVTFVRRPSMSTAVAPPLDK